MAGHGQSAVVDCRDVTFSYGRREVLHGVSLALTAGVTGLLGPNGAGKSTFLSILATVRAPSGGTVVVDGQNLTSREGRMAARRVIGYLPQRFDLMLGSSLRRNAAYAAWTQGVPAERCDEAALESLDLVGLASQADDRAGRLSGGQRQRLGIACAVVHRPEVLLLDEPTVGIDPIQRIEIRRYLRQIARTTAVVVSTHIVEDVAQTASRVLVIDGGRLWFDGSVAELETRGASDGKESASALELGYTATIEGAR